MKAEAIVLLGVLAVAAFLYIAGKAVSRAVTARHNAGPEFWIADARPALDGGTEIVLIRRREVRPFDKLPKGAPEAQVDDRMTDAELRCETLNRPALQRRH